MSRDYHIYRDVWTAVVSKELLCQMEPFNAADAFAVAVVKENTVKSD